MSHGASGVPGDGAMPRSLQLTTRGHRHRGHADDARRQDSHAKLLRQNLTQLTTRTVKPCSERKTVENEPAPSILANSGVASAKVKRSRSDHQGDAPAMRQPGRGSLDPKLMAGIPEHRASALARLQEEEVARSGVGPKRSRWGKLVRLHYGWVGKCLLVLLLTMGSWSRHGLAKGRQISRCCM